MRPAASKAFGAWREERRREQQRREVIAKHTKKGAPAPEIKTAAAATVSAAKIAPVPPVAPAETASARAKSALARAFGRSKDKDEDQQDVVPAAIAAPAAVSGPKSFAPPKPPKVVAPSLPLPDPEPMSKAPAERRKGDYALPPVALLDAPKTERKIDERELMDERAAARGEVPRVLGRRQRRADSSRARSSRPSSSSRTPA